jgi:predicted GNAT family acetyltransferase
MPGIYASTGPNHDRGTVGSVTDEGVETRVIRNADRRRYEVWSGHELAGFSAYREVDRDSEPLTVFTHTEIEPAFEGQGLGSRLVRDALDDVVHRGRAIVPICPFVAKRIRATSDYDEMVRWPEDSTDE